MDDEDLDRVAVHLVREATSAASDSVAALTALLGAFVALARTMGICDQGIVDMVGACLELEVEDVPPSRGN